MSSTQNDLIQTDIFWKIGKPTLTKKLYLAAHCAKKILVLWNNSVLYSMLTDLHHLLSQTEANFSGAAQHDP